MVIDNGFRLGLAQSRPSSRGRDVQDLGVRLGPVVASDDVSVSPVRMLIYQMCCFIFIPHDLDTGIYRRSCTFESSSPETQAHWEDDGIRSGSL